MWCRQGIACMQERLANQAQRWRVACPPLCPLPPRSLGLGRWLLCRLLGCLSLAACNRHSHAPLPTPAHAPVWPARAAASSLAAWPSRDADLHHALERPPLAGALPPGPAWRWAPPCLSDGADLDLAPSTSTQAPLATSLAPFTARVPSATTPSITSASSSTCAMQPALPACLAAGSRLQCLTACPTAPGAVAPYAQRSLHPAPCPVATRDVGHIGKFMQVWSEAGRGRAVE